MHTEHLYNKCMITRNTFDYAQLGLTVARFASQLKPGISIDCNMSFGGPNGSYFMVGLFTQGEAQGQWNVIKTFYDNDDKSVRETLDEVFAFCIENDLFKQPLDIKLVD